MFIIILLFSTSIVGTVLGFSKKGYRKVALYSLAFSIFSSIILGIYCIYIFTGIFLFYLVSRKFKGKFNKKIRIPIFIFLYIIALIGSIVLYRFIFLNPLFVDFNMQKGKYENVSDFLLEEVKKNSNRIVLFIDDSDYSELKLYDETRVILPQHIASDLEYICKNAYTTRNTTSSYGVIIIVNDSIIFKEDETNRYVLQYTQDPLSDIFFDDVIYDRDFLEILFFDHIRNMGDGWFERKSP